MFKKQKIHERLANISSRNTPSANSNNEIEKPVDVFEKNSNKKQSGPQNSQQTPFVNLTEKFGNELAQNTDEREDDYSAKLKKSLSVNSQLVSIIENLNGKLLSVQEQHNRTLFKMKNLKTHNGNSDKTNSEIDKSLTENLEKLKQNQKEQNEIISRMKNIA